MVRVRFAPSPTGYLHIGGARTALFNWLYARKHKGVFVLRVEDTDQGRSTEASLEAILEGLKWLGIDWDEGPQKGGPHAPYFQMQRLARYREVAEQLCAKGLAYRDYATADEVKAMRLAFAKEKGLKDSDDLKQAGFKYRSPWRDKTESREGPVTYRFKMGDESGTFGFDDEVLGRIDKPFDDFDDFVLIRPDGAPLYNFGCVVDDHDMQITHVGRGQEHINSTFPQLLLYRALGWTPPTFAHFPLILGQDREKLSKRKHPEADVMRHRENGVLPHALLNFVMRLGWSHGDEETFTREQLIEKFDFKNVGSTSSAWDPKKLEWFSGHWMKNSPLELVVAEAVPFLHKAGIAEAKADAKLTEIVKLLRERAATLVELADKARMFYGTGVTLDAAAKAKHLTDEGKKALGEARTLLGTTEWQAPALEGVVKTVSEALKIGMGKVAQPIRVAVTGNTASPGIGETLQLIGRDEALARIDAALKA